MTRDDPPPYRVSEFFALRTPLLPFTDYLSWAGDLHSPKVCGDSAALQGALGEDKRRLRARLLELIGRPEVREALYLASPTLDQSLEHWRRDPDSTRGLEAELVLVRYLQRMTHRCTPFGLFAGHSVGRFAAETATDLAASQESRRCTRLDRGFLNKLIGQLQGLPALRQAVTLRPNTSLYRIGDGLRYTEFENDAHGYRKYKLVSVSDTPYLRSTLERAAIGAPLPELAAALAADTESTLDEASAYIHELLDAQVLVPDLELPITGPEALEVLASQLQTIPETRESGRVLAHAAEQMRIMDESGVGLPPKRYQTLINDLESLAIPVDPARVWMVDLFKPAGGFSLGSNVAMELERCAALVERITPSPQADSLATFREAFRKRYGERWVPLAVALDAETGILPAESPEDGASTLLAGFVAGTSNTASAPGWSSREIFLFRQMQTVLARGEQEWSLSDADLAALDARASEDTCPDTADLTVRLAAASAEAIDRGDFRLLLIGCFGPPGTRMLARFCYGDAQLNERTRDFLLEEAQYKPDAILAELVHLPQGRSGNVLTRPVLRGHELVFLARSGAQPDRQIRISDLLLGLSGDRLVLYSPSHRKEVIPLLTSALAFSQTLGISQFFGALVKQNTRNWLGWSWGKLGDEPFLPRVSRGRIVLVRATWRVQKSEVESIVKQRDAERFRGIQRWRHERRLPRLCLLIDNDNELLLDLDNILSIDTFCDLVRNRPYFVLQENFPGSDELAARGPDGGYTNEIVVPLLRRTLPANRNRDDIPAPRPPSTAKQPPDVLAPGSDWLYFKLYCGEGTADAILTRTLAPAISQWRSQGVIDSWFFIRYSDPDSHLRVRLHGNASALGGVALREMHRVLDPFLQNAQLWRIELGTYEREIGRYGGPLNIERAERLFELDSEAALEIVRACSADAGAVWRWQLALAGSDRWLRDFGLDLAGRRAFARSARDGYIKEFGASNKATQGWLAERFRKERKAITPLISLTHEPSSPAVAVGLEALATRSRLAAPLIREMHDLNSCGELSCPIAPILHSLIHMFCNRVLRSSQRLQEMVLYEFLARLYDSELARCEQRDRLPVHG